MDATVATGASAMMAIRVLLDHDVPEENINLVINNFKTRKKKLIWYFTIETAG
jgi:predicted membrane-bound mannosyltransferase